MVRPYPLQAIFQPLVRLSSKRRHLFVCLALLPSSGLTKRGQAASCGAYLQEGGEAVSGDHTEFSFTAGLALQWRGQLLLDAALLGEPGGGGVSDVEGVGAACVDLDAAVLSGNFAARFFISLSHTRARARALTNEQHKHARTNTHAQTRKATHLSPLTRRAHTR